jgi:manganese oxidase
MSETDSKRNSRRKFLKTTAIAGGAAAVVGLSMGLPALTKATTTQPTQQQTANSNFLVDNNNNNSSYGPSSYYKPQERWFFLHTTDGIAWLPTDKFGLARRPIYMYGYAKPVSDTVLIDGKEVQRPSGYPVGYLGDAKARPPNADEIVKAFADTNWIDSNTGQPVMRGKAQINGPPIWGIEGDILDITMFNLGFAFGSCVTDPHTIHLHGVHSPTPIDGIPEISFGIPMWNPYKLDSTGCPILPTDGTGAGADFTPATANTIKEHSFTYRMYCERPGTYMYHCHVEASEHVQMGMSGPMWIYPKNYASVPRGGAAYNNDLTQFDQELFLMYTDIDSRWHDSIMDVSHPSALASDVFGSNLPPGVQANDVVSNINAPQITTEPLPTSTFGPAINNFNIPDFRPDWCLVNGRALPDTVLAGKYNVNYQQGLLFNPTATPQGILSPIAQQVSYYQQVTGLTNAGASAGWRSAIATPFYVPRQPVQTYIRTDVADKMLARVILMGYHDIALHFHGVMPNIVGKDTFAWVPQPNSMFSTTTDQRQRIFTLAVSSGETWDLLTTYPDKAAINANVYGFLNKTPVNNPFSASEVGGDVTGILAATPQFNYADAVKILDPSSPPIPIASVPLPAANGTGFATGFTNGYPLLYLWHDHDDYLVTNNGSYPGGAVALVRVDRAGTVGPKNPLPKLLIPV